jgi:hypothetical protein
MAEQRKAFQFFGANIMQRIIEEGKYIKTSPDGTSTAYVPPDEYKAGKVIGSVLANPGSVAGIPKMAQVGLAATMQGMGKVAQSFQQLAQTYPAAANLVAGVGKWGAIGFLWKNMHEL